jgi:hypothetical protein
MLISLVISLLCASSQAGVFNIPHFVPQGDFAVGLEPEFVLTSGAGVGANLKVTHGITTFANAGAFLGTGTGPQKFRVGGNLTFDFFPDVDKQPGIGISTQLGYFRLEDSGQLELTATPYIHKAFKSGDNEIDPFLAVPFGWAFQNGSYVPISTLAIGAIFKATEHLSYIAEFGIAINHRESYLSGGIVYYP